MQYHFQALVSRVFISAALGVAAFSAQAAVVVAQPAFTITFDFAGGGLTAPQQSYFNTAANFWESVITGYKPGVNLNGITIGASAVSIDGVGGILGSAGPSSITAPILGTRYATAGSMQFDSDDISAMTSNGSFGDVIRHEIAHVIGFGTLWVINNLYDNGTGKFTGANALAAYKTEFNQASATFVPVELGGGAGTANGHWNEVDNGSANTGITTAQGRDMRFELMTGWLNRTANDPAFVSQMTARQFEDLGYTVNVSAVPEPASAAMLLAGMALLAGVVSKRRRAAV